MALAFAVPAPAQQPFAFNATVGPDPAPLGCLVHITVSNDRPGSGGLTGCPWEVFDANMQLVYEPTCVPNPVLIGPYGWISFTWDQRDLAGNPVPPGDYFVRVTFDPGFGEPAIVPLTVGGAELGHVLEGTATISETITGEDRPFQLCSPLDPGAPFLLLASTSADVGIPTCGGTFPLDLDALLLATLVPNGILTGSFGNLSNAGTSSAPRLDLPPLPSIVGLSIHTAFATLEFAAPCVVRRISLPVEHVILP